MSSDLGGSGVRTAPTSVVGHGEDGGEAERLRAAEFARVKRIRSRFLREYGVKLYPHDSSRSLFTLLDRGGADREKVREVARQCFGATNGYIGRLVGPGSPFRHNEFLGRDWKALFLVGHPYTLNADADVIFDGLRSLGLTVQVRDATYSWHGFDSKQVLVYPKAALLALGLPLPA
jgi:hypothetical protein